MKLKNSLIGYLTVLVTTFCISLTTSETTIAQDGASLVEEIVVTARKREENILDVPLAITALSASDIEDKGISEFKDIIAFTPGFHLQNTLLEERIDPIEYLSLEACTSAKKMIINKQPRFLSTVHQCMVV